MTSLWLDSAEPVVDDDFPGSNGWHDPVDDLVVGAGLTGLTTALLLARAGRRVAVLEARHVGAAASGNTTAKLSLLQGTHLSRIVRHRDRDAAADYVSANREAQEWLLRFCETHEVPVQRRPAATYAATAAELPAVRREHEAAESLGLGVEWQDSLDVPFPHSGATVLADQAQFDPLDVLLALVSQLREHGGTVHQGRRVTGLEAGTAPRLQLADGTTVAARNVVVATGAPVFDRALHFARLEPQRSYALAFDSAVAPSGMYLSAGKDSRSVRDVPGRGGAARLLVGGSGHTVGRTRSEQEHVRRLREWTATYFPDAVETHQWSAQDYATPDGVPFVGRLPGGAGHVYVATGYEKWGMTNAVAAARVLSGQILGSEPAWGRVMGSRLPGVRSGAEVARINGGVAVALAQGVGRVISSRPPEAPPEGVGEVGHEGAAPVARSTVDGRTCAVAALCTHLGGVVTWNDVEKSWDCPLHGSRFAPDGSVIEGPATTPLAPRSS